MKTSKRNDWIIYGLLAVAVAAIALAMPKEGIGNQYEFQEGRPWTNKVLIAPFDITLELSHDRQQQIQDSVAERFVHFYAVDEDQKILQQRRVFNSETLTSKQKQLLAGALTKVYDDGIVDNATADSIASGRYTRLRVIGGQEGRESTEISVEPLRSQRQAYAYIDTLLSKHFDNEELLAMSVQDYITPNYRLDKNNDTKALESEVQKALSMAAQQLSGKKVLAGQSIVSYGEIVSPRQAEIITKLNEMMESSDSAKSDKSRLLGRVLVLVILMFLFNACVRSMRLRMARQLRNWLFWIPFLTLFVVAVMVVVRFRADFLYVVPFAIVPIIVTTFYDARISFFIHLIVVFICSLVVAKDVAQFIIMQFLAGLIAVTSMQELTRRSQLVLCSFIIFIAYCVTYLAMQLLQGVPILQVEWRLHITLFAINCILLSFAYAVIYIVEKIYGFTSTMTLVELSDINNPMLRELAESCPGTFQHALQVANIASQAAVAIGANTQLVRAGALYHDIGKIENPAFFTENQHGVNPHDALEPQQSAQIVIRHIEDGLRRASKARLPQVVRDMIAQHHGQGITRYFYAQARKANPDAEIDPAPFTYPGPNPRTKEAAILMMADSCEAATKSLKDPGAAEIKQLIERIVGGQVAEGLLREAPISFRDVETVKRVLAERLAAIYYTRISYPEDVQPRPKASPADDSLDA